MTATCQHPLANPFNVQKFTNFNILNACAGKYAKIGAAYAVPESQLTYNDIAAFQQNLHVPNQDVPLGDQLANCTAVDNNIVKCPDGTVLDFEHGKVLQSPSCKDGEWSESRVLAFGISKNNEWIDEYIYKLADLDNLDSDPGMSKNDLMYWEYADKMSQQLCSNMDISQKILLAELSGYGFFKTNLIEEDDA